jgi:SAM-dependent methyltransferase
LTLPNPYKSNHFGPEALPGAESYALSYNLPCHLINRNMVNESMDENRKEYIPALSYDWLTFLYDPLIRLTMREMAFKRHLIRACSIREGHRVLDLGCGTATLTLLIKKTHPGAEVRGLDGDERVLEIAWGKAERSGLEITLDRGMSYDLPYPDGSFDRVLSSLVFHHLTREKKKETFQEILRVLRPGGGLHVADWGKPQNMLMRLASLPLQLFDGVKTTSDNVKGLLPEMFKEAGFEEVKENAWYMTLFGTLSLYSAHKHR